MDRPLALDAERGRALGARRVAVGIGEVAERAVDRTQAVGAAGDRHAREREVPLVARVVGVEAADDDGARLVEGGVVGDAEVHRLEPAGRGGDGFDVGHAERRLDQRFGADPVREALRHLDLADDALDRIDVGRHADLRDQDGVELGAGLLHDVDDVAVHVVRVEAVDAHRHRLAGALPVDVVQRLDDVLARLLLVRRRDGVLAVEEDVVGRALDGLVDHGRVGARHGELAALQAGFAEGKECVAHRGRSSWRRFCSVAAACMRTAGRAPMPALLASARERKGGACWRRPRISACKFQLRLRPAGGGRLGGGAEVLRRRAAARAGDDVDAAIAQAPSRRRTARRRS